MNFGKTTNTQWIITSEVQHIEKYSPYIKMQHKLLDKT